VVLAGAGSVPAVQAAEKGKGGGKKPEPIFLGEGLSYIVKKTNDSVLASVAPAAQEGDFVIIDYIAYLKDGTIFDNTKKRGKPLTFQLGKKQNIVGLEKGITGMRSGEQRMLFIPSKLAYGEKGVCLEDGSCLVPPNTDIVYDVTVVRVAPPA
jgi:FKBP-type peptidyl-prolyl cis-trans isomerase